MNKLPTPSNRNFAVMFVAVFGLLAAWRFFLGDWLAWLWLIAAISFGLTGLLAPKRLMTLNRLWMRFGNLLNRIVNPLVLGLMYLILIMPVGVVMKLFGRDIMQRKFDSRTDSYWQHRENPTTKPENFHNQF